MSKVAIIIPARIGSTRLERKPLIDIDGKPMLICCAEQASIANVGDLYVACDCDELAILCEANGYKSILTDSAIRTGTDRVHAAYKSLNKDYEYIINLQGDMPKINPQTIYDTVHALISNEDEFDIMTPITRFEDIEEHNDLANVSAIVAHPNTDNLNPGDVVKALYFTRTPNFFAKSVYKHIGLYGYKTATLERFVSLSQSKLELEEKLEQLRGLENGLNIGCIFVDDHVISIDTQRDLERLLSSRR